MISPQKFYKLFLREVKKSGIESTLWNNNKKWTKIMLKDKNCVMEKMAKNLGLFYCNEYFTLDGVFYRKKLGYGNWDIRKNYYAQNIEVIIEHENNPETIEKEMNKLPLFLTSLKVVITYVGADKYIQKIERIENFIKERIKNDDLFSLHKKNKIKTLLIVGFKRDNEISWRGSILKNGKFASLALK